MSKVVISVSVQPLEEGGFMAVCDDIQGCNAQGQTMRQALENIAEVATSLLEIQKQDGLSLPIGVEPYTLTRKLTAQIVVSVPKDAF